MAADQRPTIKRRWDSRAEPQAPVSYF